MSISLQEFILAISELPDDTLVLVKTQLEGSIQKLKLTNSQLQQEINDKAQDAGLYQEIITENEQVISSQNTRIAAVNAELKKRGFNDVDDQAVYL